METYYRYGPFIHSANFVGRIVGETDTHYQIGAWTRFDIHGTTFGNAVDGDKPSHLNIAKNRVIDRLGAPLIVGVEAKPYTETYLPLHMGMAEGEDNETKEKFQVIMAQPPSAVLVIIENERFMFTVEDMVDEAFRKYREGKQ